MARIRIVQSGDFSKASFRSPARAAAFIRSLPPGVIVIVTGYGPPRRQNSGGGHDKPTRRGPRGYRPLGKTALSDEWGEVNGDDLSREGEAYFERLMRIDVRYRTLD